MEERSVPLVEWLSDHQTQTLYFPPLSLIFLNAEKVMGGSRWNPSPLQKAVVMRRYRQKGRKGRLRQGETGKPYERSRVDWAF